jgi:hypothetical protein
VKQVLCLFALLSLPASAELTPTARFTLSVSTASVVSIGSSVIGGVIALSVPGFCTQQFGSPRPMCAVAGIALAGATQLLFSLLLIPEVFRINGSEPGAVREAWWRWARWPAAVLAVSALIFLAGAASEQHRYGTGEVSMLAGMGGAATSGITVDVMGIIGAIRAAQGLK